MLSTPEQNLLWGVRIIYLIKAGLWNSVGEMPLLGAGTGLEDGFIVGQENDFNHLTNKYREVVKIKTTTVDKILQDYNIEKVDIFKIDIEGSEKEVLESSFNWIEKINAIIIELHERKKKACNNSLNKIAKGFENRCEDGEDVYLSKDNKIIKRKD